jgi:3-hydroxyisobutyrate dehydrogenase
MGSAIAGRLVDSRELFVNDRNPAAADALVSRGARFASLDEIAKACRFVFLSLPGPADVSNLLLGPDGLAARLSSGTVVIDTTTSTPTADKEIVAMLEPLGIAFCDSPIAGGVRRAEAGTATLMVGASDEVFAKVQGILGLVTSEVFHVGPVGAGHTMKLVNNLLNACNRFAAIEAVRLAEQGGIDRNMAIEVINKSSARNYATEYTYPQLLSGPPEEPYKLQGFTLQLTRKDVRLANELAKLLGVRAPVGSLVESLMEEAVARFGGNADQSQMMYEWYEN